MKLKVDQATGKAEVLDGKPVYVHDDGREIPFDAAAAVSTIKRVSDERDTARTESAGHANALKAFEGLDPAAARDALGKLKNLDSKKLIDAGEVDKVKAELLHSVEAKLGVSVGDLGSLINGSKTVAEALKTKAEKIRQLTVGAAFANSGYFNGEKPKTTLTPEIGEAYFGHYFEPTDDGKVVARVEGREVQSREKPGESASFDEAISILIEQLPNKNRILAAPMTGGAGARGGAAADGAQLTAGGEGVSPEERLARAWSGGAARR